MFCAIGDASVSKHQGDKGHASGTAGAKGGEEEDEEEEDDEDEEDEEEGDEEEEGQDDEDGTPAKKNGASQGRNKSKKRLVRRQRSSYLMVKSPRRGPVKESPNRGHGSSQNRT